MDEGLDLDAIVCALAQYLRANPQASDTAEGIRRWWFDTELEVTMKRLEIALGWLRDRRVIEEVRALDGRMRYRRLASDTQLDALLRRTPQD
jgi:hypothetical protein